MRDHEGPGENSTAKGWDQDRAGIPALHCHWPGGGQYPGAGGGTVQR